MRGHWRQVHAVCAFVTHWSTYHSGSIADSKSHEFFCSIFSRKNYISLIFTVFIIHYNDSSTDGDSLNGLLNRIQLLCNYGSFMEIYISHFHQPGYVFSERVCFKIDSVSYGKLP